MQAEQLQPLLRQMLAQLPADWRGTTFKNSELLGREGCGEEISDGHPSQRRGRRKYRISA
jgi:hypothetical protein